MVKISVIVPIYNVSRYIVRCAESLLAQTMQNVEYIFVNDCTRDNSIQLLEEVVGRFPGRCGMVHIMHHSVNMGLPAARNTGMAVARGEYIYHCDSDDYIEPTMLEEMYGCAKENDADMVWCDWFLTLERTELYRHQPSYDNGADALKGALKGEIIYNVWNKLVRRSVYEDYGITFPSGYSMGEDMTMIQVISKSNKLGYMPKAFYHYVKTNTGAITNEFSKEKLNALRYNVERTVNFLKANCNENVEFEIACMKLGIKFPFLLVEPKQKMYRLWSQWYPEADEYIWKNRSVAWRLRALQWCAHKKWYWAIVLHYWVVLRFLYGIMHR